MPHESKYLGIGTKILVMVCALVIGTSCAVGFFTYLRFKEVLVGRQLSELSTLSRVASTQLSVGASHLRGDALFLSGIPAVQGIVRARLNYGFDPVDDVGEVQWQARLAAIFEAVLRSKPDYVQVRLIGVADGGREILRVDRSADGKIFVVPGDQLQKKGNRGYFQQAIKLPAGSAYISEIELNRELDNQLTLPYQPVIRAATAIYTETGELFGIVIINRCLTPLFEELHRNLHPDQTLYITNDQGDFLVHPNATKMFGFELGHRHRLQEEFPQLQDAIFDSQKAAQPVIEQMAESSPLAFGWDRVNFDPENPGRFVAISLAVPFDTVAAEATRARNLSIVVAAAVLLPALVIGYGLSRSFAQPLQQIAAAATAFGRGEREVPLPLDASDETGVVARALHEMINQVRTRTQLLKNEIAERHRAEQHIHEANDELARRGSQIERFNKQLARSNDELKQFAYVASHDLQEPLHKVISFCEMLRIEYGDRLDGDGLTYIEYAVAGARRMKALITDLLDYSRVDTQGRPLVPTSADESLRIAIENLEIAAAKAGATIECSPLPIVAADQVQLVRLFQNLIGNAIKYRCDAPPQINIWAEERDGECIFHVQDNGLGIDSKYHARIFVIFQRLHAREAYAGTGIGLAVCKRIVERFGGRIWVESALGKGSDFCFALPVVKAVNNQADANKTDDAERAVLQAV